MHILESLPFVRGLGTFESYNGFPYVSWEGSTSAGDLLKRGGLLRIHENRVQTILIGPIQWHKVTAREIVGLLGQPKVVRPYYGGGPEATTVEVEFWYPEAGQVYTLLGTVNRALLPCIFPEAAVIWEEFAAPGALEDFVQNLEPDPARAAIRREELIDWPGFGCYTDLSLTRRVRPD